MSLIDHRRHGLRMLAGTAATIAMPSLSLRAWAQVSTPLRPTPAQTEGPFYPVELPADSDSDLLFNRSAGARAYTKGVPASLEGTLTDTAGRALAGASIEIWQCDHDGHYHHPGDGGRADPAFQGFGRSAVDEQGRWRFRTMRPAAYTGRTPHIHVKVRLGKHELLTTQLYVQGEAGNAGDFLWRRMSAQDRAAVTAPFVPAADGLRASYALVVEA
jgi:protocatechuate 3,4-dioxygenase beta subunit